MRISFTPYGVCSRKITVAVKDGVISEIQFYGGCDGNAKGIAALAVGMKPEEVIARLEGIECGRRGTSCPDQLAQALKSAYQKA